MSGRREARVRWRWLVGYAAASALAFPHPVAGRVVDLGLVAAWLAPACLVLGLRGLGPRAAAKAGFLAGWLAHSLIFHWIYVVTVVYGHGPPPIGVAAAVGLALYPAVFVAVFAAAEAHVAPRGGIANPFAAAALWAALDQGRTWLLTGFPWALLGYAQHRNLPLLAWAPYVGVIGLSFLTALGGVGLAQVLAALRRERRLPAPALAALGVVASAHLGGAWLASRPEAAEPTLRMAVLQGNIDQGVKWNPVWAERTLAIYEGLTRRAAARGARLVVWPETAIPGSPDASEALRERLGALARETQVALVVGAVGLEGQGETLRYFDSAFVIDPEGAFRDRYDKAHLVPFGEYVPLRAWLGHFVSALARGVASTDVSLGDGPRPLAVPVAGGVVSAGVPICYELLFPDLVRRFVGGGAEVLLAMTNDAWYGRTGAPYQFLAITALRSAENRVWTARAANTGVSAFIDDRGRVRARTDIFERDLLVADVPLRAAPVGGSFYSRHGDWFAWGCWIAGAALLLGRRRGESET